MAEKSCSKCKEVKVLTEFRNNQRTKDGKQSWCKSCATNATSAWEAKNKDQLRATKTKWVKENPERIKNAKLKNRYGITVGQYNAMLEAQNYCCAICKIEPKSRLLYVDHNHITNHVRKLLCHACNSVLGYVGEDVTVLKSMIDYLVKHNG